MPAMMRQTTPIVWNAPDKDQDDFLDALGMKESPHVDVRKIQRMEDDRNNKKSSNGVMSPPVPTIEIPTKGRSFRSKEDKRDPLSRSHHRSSSRRRRETSASRSPKPGLRREPSSRSLGKESRGSSSRPNKELRRSERSNSESLRKASSGSDLRSSRNSRHLNDSSLRKAASGNDLRSSFDRLRPSRSASKIDQLSRTPHGKISSSKLGLLPRSPRGYSSSSRLDPLSRSSHQGRSSSSKLDLLSRSYQGHRTREQGSSQQNELFVLPPHLKEPTDYTKEDFKEACRRQGVSPPRSNSKGEPTGRERSSSKDKPPRSRGSDIAQSDRGQRSRTMSGGVEGKPRALSRDKRSQRRGKGELSLSDHHGQKQYLRSTTKELLLAAPLPSANGLRKCPKGFKEGLQPEPLTLKPTFRSHQAKGRNPMLADLEADYKQAHQEKTLSAKAIALKEQLEKAKMQWVNIRTDTSAEIAAMRREFMEKKQAMIQDFAIRKRVMQQEAAAGISGTAALPADLAQELKTLQQENEDLVHEVAEVAAQIREAQTEKFNVEKANREAASMMKSLEAFVAKKEKDQEKLLAAHSKIEKIYNGSVAIALEPELKKHYRNCMYKCLEGTRIADRYDHDVYLETLAMVRACEEELGCEVLQPGGTSILEEPVPSPSREIFTIDEGNASFAITDEDMDVNAFTQDAEQHQASFSVLSDILHESQLTTLHENKDMLVTMFKFLDKDGGGTIDMEEFRMGIDLLNRRLPESVHIQNPQALFDALDVDRSGALDLEEFASFFTQTSGGDICAQG